MRFNDQGKLEIQIMSSHSMKPKIFFQVKTFVWRNKSRWLKTGPTAQSLLHKMQQKLVSLDFRLDQP